MPKTPEPENVLFTEKMPAELLVMILSYCDVPTLCTLACTCKYLNLFINHSSHSDTIFKEAETRLVKNSNLKSDLERLCQSTATFLPMFMIRPELSVFPPAQMPLKPKDRLKLLAKKTHQVTEFFNRANNRHKSKPVLLLDSPFFTASQNKRLKTTSTQLSMKATPAVTTSSNDIGDSDRESAKVLPRLKLML